MAIKKAFHKGIEAILTAKTPSKKIELFSDFYKCYKDGSVFFEKDFLALVLKKPSYNPFCKIIAPQNVPKRKTEKIYIC